MLDYKILELDHGVSYGSVTLKSLQNDYVPELDLLVREAIQNSSDASLGEPGDSFKVNFTTGYFCPKDFNLFMTDLGPYLDKDYPENQASFLEIRDTKTSGLTGPIRKADITRDDHGNFKLIFDTGKRQTQEGAGGIWGFGKSVYYRVGIGIVIFYSRVKIEDCFESRLIITLVEDESGKNLDGTSSALLSNLNGRSVGKAWWGIKDGEEFLPVTNQEDINELLNVFRIDPFKNDETGTSVIIPYIDSEKILDDIVPMESGLPEDIYNHFISVYGSDIESYLKLAIQKWYAPKIHNRNLLKICDNKKWLHVSVNGKAIRKQDMLPFFQLVQELYTSALAKNYQTEYSTEHNYVIDARPVNIQKYFENGITSGFVAVSKISKDELYGSGMYLSPYVLCGCFAAEGGLNEPMVMYTRDPGMVIEYSVSGFWVKNIPWPESEDEFIFGFYVPDTKKKIKSDLEEQKYAGKTLGEYLRACEASDHMGWSDPAKMFIVTRIQRNTVNQILKVQTGNENRKVDATASRLSGKLGKLLMPRVGYDKKPKSGNESSGGNGGFGGSTSNMKYTFSDYKFIGDELQIQYCFELAHNKRTVDVEVIIESEGGRIDADSWQKDIGTGFPVTISSISVDTMETSSEDNPNEIGLLCSSNHTQDQNEFVELEIEKSSDGKTYTSFKVKSHVLAPESED